MTTGGKGGSSGEAGFAGEGSTEQLTPTTKRKQEQEVLEFKKEPTEIEIITNTILINFSILYFIYNILKLIINQEIKHFKFF